MTIDQERTYIMQHPKYKHSQKWRARVMRMPEPQVHAIFKQFQKVDYNKVQKQLNDNKQYHQMNIFEYMEGKKDGVSVQNSADLEV